MPVGCRNLNLQPNSITSIKSDDMENYLTPQHLKCCWVKDLIGNVGGLTHFPQLNCGKVPPKSTEEKLMMVPSTAKYSSMQQ